MIEGSQPRRLTVEHLSIRDLRGNDIVTDANFTVEPGSVLAVIGESGCGKTSVALSLLGYARPGMKVGSGRVMVGDIDVLALDKRTRRALRGAVISHVPQDAASSLNPRQRIGEQVEEVLTAHHWPRAERKQLVRNVIERVALPSDSRFLRRYPFEVSGGQLQRVAIAMAIVARPDLVVLDEPTTGLDVTTQAKILDMIRCLVRETGAAFVYVSHDLAVVEGIADEIVVMYAGQTVEAGGKEDVFGVPIHPYTRMLLKSVPRRLVQQRLVGIPGVAPRPGEHPKGCLFAPRCPLRLPKCDVSPPDPIDLGQAHYVHCYRAGEALQIEVGTGSRVEARPGGRPRPQQPLLEVSDLEAGYRGVKVVHKISFALGAGECLGLVGESGSGKTTIARSIAGLHTDVQGTILLDSNPLAWPARARSRPDRRTIQLIFQNPDRSLNPRETVETAILRAMRLAEHHEQRVAHVELTTLLARVRLPSHVASLYPRDLSGGEKQRVAIARALATGPRVLICDEITSALDVSIQAAIVDLLSELRTSGLALLFITHHLPLVSAIAEQVIVLKDGQVQERGKTAAILEDPQTTYTRELIAAAPELAQRSDTRYGSTRFSEARSSS